MAYTDWSVTKFRLVAVIEGVTVEVIQVVLNFALNSIPTCDLSVAIGREVYSLLPSSIHSIIDGLNIQVPAQVYCEAVEGGSSIGDSGPVDSWPAGPFLIFDGYVAGTGFTKSRSGGAQLNLQLHHWLIDLTFSSAVTRSTAPFNASQFNLQAAFQFKGTGLPNFQSNTGADTFDTFTVTNDFWGDALKPWLLELCSKDILSVDEDDNAGENFEAVDALNRIEGESLGNGSEESPDDGGYDFGVKLSMDFDVLGIDKAVESIIEDISEETFSSLACTTIWDKIINNYASSYKFSLVPLVDSALVVPFTPGMRDEWVTIDPSEYESITLNGNLLRPIRGVAIFSGVGSMTGAKGGQEGREGDIQELGGFYENPDVEDGTQGMILFHQGPKWLVNFVATSAEGVFAAAPGGIKANAADPGAGEDPPGEDPGEVREKAKTVWDEYARCIYIAEVLKGRKGSLSGKVRFDIAPGSTIRLITIEEKFVSGALGLGENVVYAEVTAVTIMLNAEAVKGSTTIGFSYIRSEEENELDGYSTDNHPLYSSYWNGAPLVELDEFDHGFESFINRVGRMPPPDAFPEE